MTYRFLIFDYNPSIWLVIANASFWLVASLVAFCIAHLISFSLFSFLVPFVIMVFVFNVILSRFKFRKKGIIIISDNGIEIMTLDKKEYPWDQIYSLLIVRINHILINKLGALGGFFRFNHVGSSNLSFQTFDRIEINGDTFFIFIRNKNEERLLEEAIAIVKNYSPKSISAIYDYKFRNIFFSSVKSRNP
jgi:hypothetical protein